MHVSFMQQREARLAVDADEQRIERRRKFLFDAGEEARDAVGGMDRIERGGRLAAAVGIENGVVAETGEKRLGVFRRQGVRESGGEAFMLTGIGVEAGPFVDDAAAARD